MSYSHTFQKGTDPNTRLNIVQPEPPDQPTGLRPKLTVEANMNYNAQYTAEYPGPGLWPEQVMSMNFSVYGSADFDVRSLKNYYQGPQGIPNLMQYNNEYGRAKQSFFPVSELVAGGITKMTFTDISSQL